MTTSTGPTRQFAVVTGASTGIGLELAKQFATHDFDVLVAASSEAIFDAADELRVHGTEITPLRVDLATAAGTEELAAVISGSGRPLDALAVNAGFGNNGLFTEIPLEDDLRLIALNVTSAVHLSKLVVPAMVARGEGRILYTSSVAATMPGPYYATYAASKSFLQSFAEALRYELKDSGVTVTALQPGPTDTPFFERADMEDTPAGQGAKDDPAEVAKDGFEALMAGRDHVVAGSIKNKLQTLGAGLLSDSAKASIHAAQTKPADV
jgi:uncharacterized protein